MNLCTQLSSSYMAGVVGEKYLVLKVVFCETKTTHVYFQLRQFDDYCQLIPSTYTNLYIIFIVNISLINTLRYMLFRTFTSANQVQLLLPPLFLCKDLDTFRVWQCY